MDVAMTKQALSDQEEFEAAMAEEEAEVLERAGAVVMEPTPAPVEPVAAPAPQAVEVPAAKKAKTRTGKAESPLVAAARKMIEQINVRRSFGSTSFNNRCILCEDTGVHSAQVMRCKCACHELRAALEGVTE